MFCYQCEQTARGTGCTLCGVCGKKEDVAHSQDALTAALIGFASTASSEKLATAAPLIENALFTTVTNVSFDQTTQNMLTQQLIALGGDTVEKWPKDLSFIWQEAEAIKSLKSTILFGLRGMAAYAHHARVLGYTDQTINTFMAKALRALNTESSIDVLLDLALELGRVNLVCMELLDHANTTSYGMPTPTSVSMLLNPGPFIVVTGHDLYDLEQLLQQTEGTGVSIYTHGEMLPAHGYPKLRAYKHLAGHFGTAWQNQQREFNAIPGALLFTTNCLMPPRASYSDRVYTTSVVRFPDVMHIKADANGKKDFTPVIRRAIELGGYPSPHQGCGINGGTRLTTGFAHGAVLSHSAEVLQAINTGALKHIVLVGGCDGARPGRNAYTEYVKNTSKETLVLTLACGKFRFNDLDLGTIGPLPRLMDMGQCNDAYSAIKVAVTLAQALKCSVNDLPLTMVLSWYEQKAVCILLTLLALGIRGIKLGPTLPAFISPSVLKVLQEKFDLRPFPDHT